MAHFQAATLRVVDIVLVRVVAALDLKSAVSLLRVRPDLPKLGSPNCLNTMASRC